ncbi:acyl-CoA dehydrogenase family protein [Mycolicibacterium sp. ELW1]|uniref:acyl-CoA dehydrogenase family protein n=1 Tax=unclassified Mycolicibacterium TaxID=2636767 RepID=UPI003D777B52
MGHVIEAAERNLLSVTLRRLAEDFDGEALSIALGDFGFDDLLAAEPREAVSSLFAAMGRAGSTSAALQEVLLSPLREVGLESSADLCVVLPAIGADYVGTCEQGTADLRGLVIGARPSTAVLLAPVVTDGETAWVSITGTDLVSMRSVLGLDPALAMSEITGTAVPATIVVSGSAATTAWGAVASAGRRALGYQISGAVGQMIDLAVAHARDRVQFGRPIGSFQGVRNRLADAYVARHVADAALDLAWEADNEYLAAMLAKSLAGRAARIAATHCQQVLAGIGFTAEHPFHRFLARALVLDTVLGSAAELPASIGAQLVSAGSIPRLVEL